MKNAGLLYCTTYVVFYILFNMMSCFSYVVVNHIGELIICKGNSMLPTLRDGDLIIAERLSVKRGNVRSGDIVCAAQPDNPRTLLCKRLAHGPMEDVRSFGRRI